MLSTISAHLIKIHTFRFANPIAEFPEFDIFRNPLSCLHRRLGPIVTERPRVHHTDLKRRIIFV